MRAPTHAHAVAGQVNVGNTVGRTAALEPPQRAPTKDECCLSMGGAAARVDLQENGTVLPEHERPFCAEVRKL